MKGCRRVLIGLLVGAVVVAILWVGRAPLLRAAAHWLDVGQPPQQADYVMLLNGGEDSRPFAVAALVKAGWAPRVLIAETAPSPEVLDGIIPPYYEINCRILRQRGVPAAKITVFPGQAATTYDEATALATFLEQHPNARVLIVTNDCHTRRSRWVFARVLGDKARQVSFVSAPSDEFSIDCWWQSQRGLLSIATEYPKLAYYAVAYGCLGYWLVACAVLLLVAACIRRREYSSRSA
jgi:uncharacterized SAM-binding protein YcdF (DUF218 family)